MDLKNGVTPQVRSEDSKVMQLVRFIPGSRLDARIPGDWGLPSAPLHLLCRTFRISQLATKNSSFPKQLTQTPHN